ncbi:efflux RND transporter periplasmic adaptor subunit [Xanthobacter versatilis]|uniref:efflux RND transporter periplasmic adaptor subunit n=1 Tax=Xanthobacter autotrophicus (strain ATCC BAA-1158 / Py2) TaxID=78245 RepID=UPI00372866CA
MARHFVRRACLGLCALLAGLMLATGASAHEGHDHGAPATPPVTTLAPRAEAASADFELVAVLRDGMLAIHLDRFADNAPVDGATIEMDTPEGVQAARPMAPGTYAVAAAFAAKLGAHDLAFTVTAGGTVDVLATTLTVPAAPALADSRATPTVLALLGGSQLGLLAGVVIGFLAAVLLMSLRRRMVALVLAAGLGLAASLPPEAQAADAPKPSTRDAAQRLPDGSVIVPKPGQRILGVRTIVTASASHARAVELPGRVVPDANASGLVQTAVGGRLAPPQGGFKPLGTKVAAGDILAYVHPPIGASDLKDLEQQGFELDQQIAIVKRRYERLSAIQNAVTRREVEETEIELKGLQTRRATLERVQREPEALRAPVAGVIATSDAVAGQMADPNTVVFRIIDPERLWVEALGFSPEVGRSGASGRLPDGRSVTLAFLGAGMSERSQAVALQFSVTAGVEGLRPGQFLTVLAEAGAPRTGIAIPRTAVVRGANGQAIVYEHVSAERFVAREVKTEPLDAGRVLVTAGLPPDRRVVTEGAELIDQIR